MVKLKKGAALSNPVEVSRVKQLVSAMQHEVLQNIPKTLASAIANANRGKSNMPKIIIRNFFFRYYDAFDINYGKKGHKIDTGDV